MQVLILAVLVGVTFAKSLEISQNHLVSWDLFKIEHVKKYESLEEEQKRMSIFLDNLNFVKEHNEKFKKGEVTFDVEINKFADLTVQEFGIKMNGFKRPLGLARTGEPFTEPDDLKLPRTVDWRTKGAVTDVKDQGQCQSCWAFSATGSLEGQTFLKTKTLTSLSEQNLIDCSRDEHNHGCENGYMDNAFIYVKKNKGLDTETSYPYEAKDDTCRYDPKNSGATVSGFVDLPQFNENKLQVAVAKVGPISVGIDATHKSFQLYKSGVYIEPACSPTSLNHGVLAVGYGKVKKGGAYWLVKNCWGTDWGMKGYIMMARNQKNMCGIATLASYPKV